MINKPILILPLAGFGKRFSENGYETPKQLLPLGKKNCIRTSLDAIENLKDLHIAAFVRDSEVRNDLRMFCEENQIEFTILEGRETSSPIDTIKIILDEIDSENVPIFVYTLDVDVFSKVRLNFDESLFTVVFKANSPSYSYVQINEDNYVVNLAEKHVISDLANLGLYGFGTFENLKKYVDLAISSFKNHAADANIIDIYAEMLNDKVKIKSVLVDNVYIFGTPSEYEFCKKKIYDFQDNKNIYLIADHSGYKMKSKFMQLFNDSDYIVSDLGTLDEKACDYCDYVHLASKRLITSPGYIFASCMTGQGINIAMNSMFSDASALIYDERSFKFSITHNCATNFSFPQDIWLNKNINFILESLDKFKFEGGRHQNRLIKTHEYKKDN